MGKQGKERAKERREKRLQEISDLRKVPINPCNRWWSSETVAVVTGANRGIGFEIARQLAAYGLHVIMTSRDAERARQAAEKLQNEGLDVKSHQLDISDQISVESFSKFVVLNYGGIDILMGKQGKERAKERREKRLQEISDLRKVPINPCNRWWSSETVAVVTGANRGIGFEIARQLAAYGLHVIMTSRDAERARQAAEKLQNEGLDVKSHQLDISDQISVESFSKFVVLNYGGIDILVQVL